MLLSLAATTVFLLVGPSLCCEFITTTLPPKATGPCKPVTWDSKHSTGVRANRATPTLNTGPKMATRAAEIKFGKEVMPGDINSRYWARTYDEVGPHSCADLAKRYHISLDQFFFLNPYLAPDCKGIRPNTEYTVRGFMEPERAWDGNCGPKFRNATCIGMGRGQCCNSETWRCGSTEHDCSPGVCYEGACWGHKQFTTDGTCGSQNEDRQCAGKWGDCCSKDGLCGTGKQFCGEVNCQSGSCVSDAKAPPQGA